MDEIDGSGDFFPRPGIIIFSSAAGEKPESPLALLLMSENRSELDGGLRYGSSKFVSNTPSLPL